VAGVSAVFHIQFYACSVRLHGASGADKLEPGGRLDPVRARILHDSCQPAHDQLQGHPLFTHDRETRLQLAQILLLASAAGGGRQCQPVVHDQRHQVYRNRRVHGNLQRALPRLHCSHRLLLLRRETDSRGTGLLCHHDGGERAGLQHRVGLRQPE